MLFQDIDSNQQYILEELLLWNLCNIYSAALGTEARAQHMLGKCSTMNDVPNPGFEFFHIFIFL